MIGALSIIQLALVVGLIGLSWLAAIVLGEERQNRRRMGVAAIRTAQHRRRERVHRKGRRGAL